MTRERARDATARAALRRESNPPNPWSATRVEWLGPAPDVEPQVHLEEARSILTRNDSPDIPFDYSLNPYRGCSHACAYCYARPTHTYLGFGAGTDFDAKIVVKINAPRLLERELARRGWKRATVCLSGNTDPYQPLEAHYKLTRACLEVLRAAHNPVVLITKGALVRRDVDVLAGLAQEVGALVHVSIPTADERVARLLEPGAPTPAVRFETLRLLADAGIPTGVAVAPLIMGLTDASVAEVLQSAAAAGATHAFHVPLRLPKEVAAVFEERLRSAFPERADKVLAAQRELRGGALNQAHFGARMQGLGPRYDAARQLFDMTARRLGLVTGEGTHPVVPQHGGTDRVVPQHGGTDRVAPQHGGTDRVAPPLGARGPVQGRLFDG